MLLRQTTPVVSLILLAALTVACGGPLFDVFRDKPADAPANSHPSGDRGRQERLNARYGDKDRLPGIPFFALELVQRTVAVYEQEYFELKLEATWETKEGQAVRTHVSAALKYARCETEARKLHALFQSSSSAQAGYDAIKKYMGTDTTSCIRLVPPRILSPSEVYAGQVGLHVTAVQRQQLAVPGKDVRYINVTKAAAGTSSSTITLNANGTLASAQAQTVDETMKTILDSLPVSDAVSAMLGLGKKPTPLIDGTAVLVSAQFTVTPVVRRYTVSVDVPLDDEAYASSLVPNGRTPGASMQVSVVRGDATPTAPKDDDSINFSGQVKLPKPTKKEN